MALGQSNCTTTCHPPSLPCLQMDAGMSIGGSQDGHEGFGGGELLSEMSLLAPGSLPDALQDVLVDISEVQPLRWLNGALQELGSGARWAAWATCAWVVAWAPGQCRAPARP